MPCSSRPPNGPRHVGAKSAERVLDRRTLLRRAGQTAAGLLVAGSLGELVSACGGGDGDVDAPSGGGGSSGAPPTTGLPARDVAFTKGLHELGRGVYAYLLPDGGWMWSNAGLIVGDDQAIVVDTLCDVQRATEMLATVRSQVPAVARITTVVNTHADGDHTFGNQVFGDAEIVTTKITADDMAAAIPPSALQAYKDNPPPGPSGEFAQAIMAPFDYRDVVPTLPTSTFEERRTLSIGGREVSLIDLGPAHTRSDVVVHLPDAAVVFAGDLLYNGVHPLVSTGPISSWIAALDRIVALDPRIVVPGHGAVADTATVTGFADYLRWLTEEATQRHAAGMTPLDAARDIVTAANPYASWLAPERMAINVNTVYRGLGDDLPTALFPTLYEQMATLWKELR
ncbi:MAG: MBL fold metallo-hydrolase [Acidimicrobiales bacterium]